MASLRHPALVPVLDVGEERGLHYVVMPLLSESLAERLTQQGPLSPRAATQTMIQILRGLQCAHDHGIIHRDLKPANILLDEAGRPLLTDFGVAWLADRTKQLTLTGVALGSWATMAPEQRLDAHAVTPAADVYAAAATLYWAVTGSSPVDLFLCGPESHRWEPVPAPLREILRDACQQDPTLRPSTAAELEDRLSQVVSALSADIPSLSPQALAPESTLREPTAAPQGAVRLRGFVYLLGASILLLLCLGFAGWSLGRSQEGTAPPHQVPSSPTKIISEPKIERSTEPGSPTSTPSSVPSDPVTTERRKTQDSPSPPPASEAEDLSGVLPFPTTWHGSCDGSPVMVTFNGTLSVLGGTVEHANRERPTRLTGALSQPNLITFNTTASKGRPETWRLTLTEDRLDGTVSRAQGAEVVPVALRPSLPDNHTEPH